MAYPRRRYRRRVPYRRSTKKYGKKYGRSRFKRKSFRKTTNFSRTLIARNQFVKLPWTYTDRETFTSGSLLPIKYAFSGNSLPGTMGIDLDSANPLFTHAPAGLDQYAQFYKTCRVHGSSIRIDLLCNSGSDQASTTQSQAVRVCLLALPYARDTIRPSVGPGTARYSVNGAYQNPKDLTFQATNDEPSTLNEMWNATYEQLINHPYAKWFTMGGNGSTSRCTLKMFRKTKNMSQVKDLKDCDEFEFPTNPFKNGANEYRIFTCQEGFVYYLYVFPTKPASTQDSIVLTVKLKYYYEFFDMVPQQNQLIGVPA